MTKMFFEHLNQNLEALKSAGLYKSERIITSKQSGNISVLPGNKVLNFCANNYLGLADNAELIEAGKKRAGQKRLWNGFCPFHLRNTGCA
jgi:glycine C-acetyltransferase